MRPPSSTNTRVATSRKPIFCSAIKSASPRPRKSLRIADHFLDEQRRQPGRRLVHHQKPRLGGKRLGNAEHLALAAGKAGRRRAALFAQRRKQAIEFLDARAGIGVAQRLRADADVFLDRQIGKYRKFRHVGHAEPHAVAGAHPRHVLAAEIDAAVPRLDQADQRFEKGRLAGAVGTEQQHGLARPHVEIDAPQHLHGAVAGIDAGSLQQRRGLRRHARLPGTLRSPAAPGPRPRACLRKSPCRHS